MNIKKTTEKFNIRNYLDSQKISYIEEGKNVGEGSVGVCCPSCEDESYHMGIHTSSKLYNCWRCEEQGNLIDFIMLFEDVSRFLAFKRLSDYEESVERSNLIEKINDLLLPNKLRKMGLFIKNTKVSLPQSKPVKKLKKNLDFENRFLYYIQSRNYSKEELFEWGVKACIHGEYNSRLIFPIYYERRLVNYLGRSILSGVTKYMNCKNEEAVINTKSLLYGYDFIHQGQDKLVICEGVFDAIRFGKGLSVALFGKIITMEQIEMVCSLNIRECIYIVFDDDAFYEADELSKELKPLVNCRVEVILLDSGKDPDNYKQKELLRRLEL